LGVDKYRLEVFGDVGGLVEAGFWAFRVRVLLSWLWVVRVFDLAFVSWVLGELVRVGSPSVGGNRRIQSFDLGDVGSQLVERTRSSKVPVPGATDVSMSLIVPRVIDQGSGGLSFGAM
jgi:hypothetical protein